MNVKKMHSREIEGGWRSRKLPWEKCARFLIHLDAVALTRCANLSALMHPMFFKTSFNSLTDQGPVLTSTVAMCEPEVGEWLAEITT